MCVCVCVKEVQALGSAGSDVIRTATATATGTLQWLDATLGCCDATRLTVWEERGSRCNIRQRNLEEQTQPARQAHPKNLHSRMSGPRHLPAPALHPTPEVTSQHILQVHSTLGKQALHHRNGRWALESGVGRAVLPPTPKVPPAMMTHYAMSGPAQKLSSVTVGRPYLDLGQHRSPPPLLDP